MYGNVRDDEARAEREQVFPRLLDTLSRDFSFRSTMFNKDPLKTGAARRYCILSFCLSLARRSLDDLLSPGGTHCYTLEVSFYCAKDEVRSQSAPFTPETYMELGRHICEALLEYYKLPSSRLGRAAPAKPTVAPPSSPVIQPAVLPLPPL